MKRQCFQEESLRLSSLQGYNQLPQLQNTRQLFEWLGARQSQKDLIIQVAR